MTRQQGWSRFEWLITVSAIGIVLLFAMVRYLDMAREGRRVGFETLAHNFTAALALTRAKWLIDRANAGEFFVELDGQLVYMNEAGWPVATEPVASVKDSKRAPIYCQQLWQTLLQNPEQATVQGHSTWGERRYHISQPEPGVCRYELITKDRGSHYFDYRLQSGQVLITTPSAQKISGL